MQLKNLLSAQGISDAAHLRGALQQALINFGSVPNLPQDLLNQTGLDTAGTQSLAENNPFSILKQLAQRYQDSQDSTKNQLAARGILSSGETGYQLGRLGQQQGQTQYDATNSLLGNIDTLESNYAAGRQAAAQQLAQGALTAENTAAQNGAGGGGGGTATYDPATGLYRDGNGNYYNGSGNPVSLPVAGQTSGQISSPPPPATIGGAAPPVAFGGTPSPQLPGASALNALFRNAGGGPVLS